MIGEFGPSPGKLAAAAKRAGAKTTTPRHANAHCAVIEPRKVTGADAPIVAAGGTKGAEPRFRNKAVPSDDGPVCTRPGCAKPAWRGKRGNYCSRRCRDATHDSPQGKTLHRGGVATKSARLGDSAREALLGETRRERIEARQLFALSSDSPPALLLLPRARLRLEAALPCTGWSPHPCARSAHARLTALGRCLAAGATVLGGGGGGRRRGPQPLADPSQ